MGHIAVLGNGSWGTALAMVLAENKHRVKLWGRDAVQIKDMQQRRENRRYLPNVRLDDLIEVQEGTGSVVRGAEVAIFSVPAQAFRSVLRDVKDELADEAILVNVAKGIELHSLMRLSEIAEEENTADHYVVLSGASHAEEVGRGLPTAIVAASQDKVSAKYVQDLFMNDKFRVYTSDDVVGVELGGALKNIIALGAGISDGAGFGDNAKAALMTRGLAEIIRLGVRLGAKPETFSGLTGIGDLIATCTSVHSRNRSCGLMIGEGLPTREAIAKVGMVVEGILTTEAAYALARREQIEMPVTEAIYYVIKETVKVDEAITGLMNREKKHE